jgi:molybdopterin synthase catalytic subunit
VQVHLLFFASLSDVIGQRRLALEAPDGATVGDVLDLLIGQYPKVGLYRPVLLTAVNQEYVEPTHALLEGDELAVFPPVSGGAIGPEARVLESPGEFYQITWDRIDSGNLARRLLAGADGAVCIFEGVVRDNSDGRKTRHLVYEAYEQMALGKLEEIGRTVRGVWEIGSVGIVHRLGRLEIGEASVAVVVTSPHRRSAFDACHYAIDRLKKVVPIWKKEFFEDGEIWIEGQRQAVP